RMKRAQLNRFERGGPGASEIAPTEHRRGGIELSELRHGRKLSFRNRRACSLLDPLVPDLRWLRGNGKWQGDLQRNGRWQLFGRAIAALERCFSRQLPLGAKDFPVPFHRGAVINPLTLERLTAGVMDEHV